MLNKFIIVVTVCLSLLHSADVNATKPIDLLKPAFVNIVSNVPDTTIYLNGDFIGKTPILRYKVTPNQDYFAYAIANKKFFKEDVFKTINIRTTTIPTVSFDFERAKGKVFLVGEEGDLYINDKFDKVLHARNRVFDIDANTQIKFKIRHGYKEVTFVKDIYADSFNEIHYKLINIPLDVRLYTESIGNEMWEDTKEAANTPITWEKAQEYCKTLSIGGYDDWYLPTPTQLTNLYKNNKDKIYNGYGGTFYWSANNFSGKNNIWQYSKVVNFEDGKVASSILEFEDGRVRCVRDINKDIKMAEANKITKENNTTMEAEDLNITKNLEQYSLK